MGSTSQHMLLFPRISLILGSCSVGSIGLVEFYLFINFEYYFVKKKKLHEEGYGMTVD